MKPSLLSFEDALATLMAQAVPIDRVEQLPTTQACGRVLAVDIQSTLNVPPMDNTQMDGYAVRAADVLPGRPMVVSQRVPAGHVPAALAAGTAARIFTGAALPAGADAVVMQEMTRLEGDAVVFDKAPPAGDWVRRTGEDIAVGDIVLARGARLTPQACGLAASVGLASLPVFGRLRVACFFTGDELAMPGEPLRPGAIYNSNRFVLVSLLRQFGCEVTDLGIVPDSLAATRDALQRAAADNDLIVTSGGMSVGEEDHVRPAVLAQGELSMWNVAIKPGKPLAHGRVNRPGGAAQFIGLPGNPVSAFVTFLLFVRPFLLRLQGASQVAPRRYALRADFSWPRADKRREFLRARMNEAGGLDLFANQGSAVLTSTVWGDGLVNNPPGQVIRPGDLVEFLPFSELLG